MTIKPTPKKRKKAKHNMKHNMIRINMFVEPGLKAKIDKLVSESQQYMSFAHFARVAIEEKLDKIQHVNDQ